MKIMNLTSLANSHTIDGYSFQRIVYNRKQTNFNTILCEEVETVTVLGLTIIFNKKNEIL